MTLAYGTTVDASTRPQAIRWTPDEQKELQSRRWNWLYYLLRNPVWEQSTKPALDTVTSRLKRVWVLRWVLGWPMEQAFEWLAYRQQFFTRTNP